MPDRWDRQPDESAKAYEAFGHYRDLAVSVRSIDAAWLIHQRDCMGQHRDSRRAARAWTAWSVRNDWVVRAGSHDSDVSKRRREQKMEELYKAQDTLADLANVGLSKVAKRLRDLDVEEISANVLSNWIRTLGTVRLEALGQASTAVEGSAAGPTEPQEDLDHLLDAKILRMAESISDDEEETDGANP